jgi:hypothetical protein
MNSLIPLILLILVKLNRFTLILENTPANIPINGKYTKLTSSHNKVKIGRKWKIMRVRLFPFPRL